MFQNVKKVVNEINVKKLKERVCANDNISKTENVKRIGEKSRAPVFKKIATRSRTKELIFILYFFHKNHIDVEFVLEQHVRVQMI